MTERISSSEPSSQPYPDIIQEALASGSFDHWLTQLPEDQLRYLYNVTEQFKTEQIADEPTLVRLIALSMLFSGNEGLHIPKVLEIFDRFGKHLRVEIGVREGNIAKAGTYSMVPEEETALWTWTEQGRQIYQPEREQ